MELEPMYMLRPIHIVFAALLFTSLPCSAQPFFVIGAGMKSCGNWTEAVQNPSVRAQYGSWVLGFLSGSNLQSSSVQGTVLMLKRPLRSLMSTANIIRCTR